MNSGNDHHSHPYNTIVLLYARKQNLYSQKLDFDSSTVDRLMQSLQWCAWMTDGLFSFFKILTYSYDKECVISIENFTITFTTVSPKWMFRRDLSITPGD